MLLQETKSATTYRVFPKDLNDHDTLYGGTLLSWLDSAASVSAHRFVRQSLVTASVDQMSFVTPLRLGNAVTLTSVVSGVGNRSLEVFVRITGEDLDSGETFLAGTAFLIFVATGGQALQALEVQTEAEQRLVEGYDKRRQLRLEQREMMTELDYD